MIQIFFELEIVSLMFCIIFFQELKYEFQQENPPLILAAGISGYREVIDVAYDMVELSRQLEFMSVMTYDYHGSWEKRTGHVSPLYYRAGDSFPRFNTVNIFVSQYFLFLLYCLANYLSFCRTTRWNILHIKELIAESF